MSIYDNIKLDLMAHPKVWLITGVAGFIGSNLLENLLNINQKVVGLDNFSTGHMRNLDEVKESVTEAQWRNFEFIEGDICDFSTCQCVVKQVDYVLHQAALGSVPRSIADPLPTNQVNVTGFLNMLHASKEEGVSSFTYASSSSVYGDHAALPKVEKITGNLLSPYAATKYFNELYAAIYALTYDFKPIGLRYFNAFGKRQDPNGPYAAVIPKWVTAMLNDEDIFINGDGETSRDFCFVENIVQVNILAALAPDKSKNLVYNVAVGHQISLNDLYSTIKCSLENCGKSVSRLPIYIDFRSGDVRHSRADVSLAINNLGYEPKYRFEEGINRAISWYIQRKLNL